MNKCPEKDCKQKTDDVHAVLLDKGGVRDQLQKKIPWTALIWIIPIFTAIIGTPSTLIYRAYSAGQDIQDKSIEKIGKKVEQDHDDISAIKTDQAVITQQVKSINEKIKESTEIQTKIFNELEKLNNK